MAEANKTNAQWRKELETLIIGRDYGAQDQPKENDECHKSAGRIQPNSKVKKEVRNGCKRSLWERGERMVSKSHTAPKVIQFETRGCNNSLEQYHWLQGQAGWELLIRKKNWSLHFHSCYKTPLISKTTHEPSASSNLSYLQFLALQYSILYVMSTTVILKPCTWSPPPSPQITTLET